MSRGKIGIKFSPSFLLGGLVGMTNLDDRLPKEVVLATAVAPISGIGVVKGAAQGIVVGNLLQNLIGMKGGLGGLVGGGISGGFRGI